MKTPGGRAAAGSFECLYPGREEKEKSENDQSMVLRVNASGTTFLFTRRYLK